MRWFAARSGASRTLRATWISSVAMLVAVTVGIGILALVALRVQHAQFSDTTADVQATTEALVELDQSILDIMEPMFGVMYRFGGDQELLAEARASYGKQRAQVLRAYDDVAEAMGSGTAGAELEQARALWTQVDETVLAAEDEYTDEDLMAAFLAEKDLFEASVWQPLEQANAHLVAARYAAVQDMGDLVAGADRLQQVTVPTFATALLLALAVALLAARRMSRRVVAPLAEVGRGAQAMDDPAHGVDIQVPGAVSEVQDLAGIINRSSASLRNHHETLRTQARTDSMTTLPNRDAFTEALHAMLDDPARARVAVLFLDIDDFKDVNDTLGHEAGDRLLQVVALRLNAATRDSEIAARLGGDEFAVAIDASRDQSAPARVAERVRQALSRPAHIGDREVAVGCSIGIAVSEPGASSRDADELLGNADFAMYMAKSQGKGRCELYSPAMHTEVQARMELGRDLTHALQRDQFVLHYQPVLDLTAERLLGFEALIRWVHPERGLIAPDDFLGLAEDSGDIVSIGAWVLDEACAALSRHREHDASLTMGVNVSPRQLLEPDFAAEVLATLARHGIPPDNLIVEITEATAMTDTEVGVAALAVLRDHGVHVALDDFGTGFSSLAQLGNLPANVIKIDRSFISNHGTDATSTLKSIILLAQRLGLSVVAEGIEEPEDLERLRMFGEMIGQGYLFARPMPDDETVSYILQRLATSTP